jgi:hypothetical protein
MVLDHVHDGITTKPAEYANVMLDFTKEMVEPALKMLREQDDNQFETFLNTIQPNFAILLVLLLSEKDKTLVKGSILDRVFTDKLRSISDFSFIPESLFDIMKDIIRAQSERM